MIKIVCYPSQAGLPLRRNIEPNLKTFQELCGGYVEAVSVAHDVVLWCNEEALIQRLPVNRAVRTAWGDVHYIHGPFFLTGPRDDEGTTTSYNREKLPKMEASDPITGRRFLDFK